MHTHKTDLFLTHGYYDCVAFEVVTTRMEQLDFEEGPHIWLAVYVKDDVAVTDLQVLTVQVTDVNEPPEFPGVTQQRWDTGVYDAVQTASGRTLGDGKTESK